ncbi:isoaspartyl peptidase/L-asparaginase [Actinocrispum sp. NPDC049592]|uniref:isoaspartyl peptidase/L-asparaginase family protein n=1 Tax=Actinocrispum sp. NPDC049592 TaxID=3154835 RepID=UPI0034173048
MKDVILAVHGGAGKKAPADLEDAYRAGIEEALRAGQRALDNCVDAVEAAVLALEDNELFNAGKGSVFTADEGHELDASIMRGSDQAAGAVAAVRSVRNPIAAARLVMESTPHVLLAGLGADDFALSAGLVTVTPDYFSTKHRYQQLMEVKGTVGAVARDTSGALAAATSTGGMTNKLTGRVGDSAVIGAGTYANSVVAVSATGDGEVFLRGMAAGTVAALMEFAGMDVTEAAAEVVFTRLKALGGTGGLIALDREGTLARPYSTPGMFHGYLTADGTIGFFG